MVEKHAIFQGYYFFHFLGLDRDLRDQFAGHPYYDLTAEFCADFDQPAFDPDYPTMTLDEFEPLLQQFFRTPEALDLPPRGLLAPAGGAGGRASWRSPPPLVDPALPVDQLRLFVRPKAAYFELERKGSAFRSKLNRRRKSSRAA